MPKTSGKQVQPDVLVQEFQSVLGLSEVDARRSAFCVLALAANWPKAKIARYLGTSRARIGQKAEKYEKYATANGSGPQMPVLSKTLKQRRKAKPQDENIKLAFARTEWESQDFAGQMLALFE